MYTCLFISVMCSVHLLAIFTYSGCSSRIFCIVIIHTCLCTLFNKLSIRSWSVSWMVTYLLILWELGLYHRIPRPNIGNKRQDPSLSSTLIVVLLLSTNMDKFKGILMRISPRWWNCWCSDWPNRKPLRSGCSHGREHKGQVVQNLPWIPSQ